ncbi:hypothetical protein LAZ67_13001738 [Cordylochernes scorpioides]|uniref:Reverse transcriptase Ty1/copia-type domain-containing protein n=1 Tax=Cordylochernes scorpioides TaxID=51811 RepID=A0ABY6L8W5_9ARAC|nr:hypothetical protein LAZ67_13001738 [Cordylochernes scorpioides]
MYSGERNEWHKAMEEELSEIEKHKVWTLVPRENGMKVINSKWVYSTKKTSNDVIYKRKARPVAVGCNQRYGVDYKDKLWKCADSLGLAGFINNSKQSQQFHHRWKFHSASKSLDLFQSLLLLASSTSPRLTRLRLSLICHRLVTPDPLSRRLLQQEVKCGVPKIGLSIMIMHHHTLLHLY